MGESLVQQWSLSSAERVPLKNLVQLRNKQKLLRKWRCLSSFGTWQDAQVPRIWSEQEQREELTVRALRILAVRALLRNLALRALLVKHLACMQASLT